MPLTTILFDLDGTLLPMDQEGFIRSYFGRLAATLAPYGYEPRKLYETIWEGTRAMVANDGTCTNEQRFWTHFCSVYGKQARKDEPIFDTFYRTDFQQVAADCGFAPKAAQIVSLCHSLGLRTALATNPLFPAIATESRIRWAGLKPADFDLITTYENARYCKPNPAYYADILQQLNVQPEECLMVGNDAEEDLIASSLGMRVFLLTDCLINRKNTDLSSCPQGSFDKLAAYLHIQTEPGV